MQDSMSLLSSFCIRFSKTSLFILCQEYKRSRHEIKKKSSDTMKLQKKARKGNDQLSNSQAQAHGCHSDSSCKVLFVCFMYCSCKYI